MHVSSYLRLVHSAELSLAESYRLVGNAHQAEAEIFYACGTVASQCDNHGRLLAPVVDRFGEAPEGEPERLHVAGLSGTRSGGLGLLRDLHDLYALCSFVDITWTIVGQAARALPDVDLLHVVSSCGSETARQLAWLTTSMKAAAPQALIVAS